MYRAIDMHTAIDMNENTPVVRIRGSDGELHGFSDVRYCLEGGKRIARLIQIYPHFVRSAPDLCELAVNVNCVRDKFESYVVEIWAPGFEHKGDEFFAEKVFGDRFVYRKCKFP